MNKTIVILTMILVLSLPFSAVAEQNTYDPFSRNIIFVSGEAEMIIPVNGFKVGFTFESEKASFKEANEDASRIIEDITSAVQSLGMKNIEVIKGWDIVRQSKISFSSKAKKITSRVEVQVIDYPEGKLQELIASIIDKSLAVNPEIAFESVEVFISQDQELKRRAEVTSQALKALDTNAKMAAESLGKKTVSPKRVFINDEDIVNEKSEEPAYYGSFSKSLVTVQKSFRVKANMADKMTIKVKVNGLYQME